MHSDRDGCEWIQRELMFHRRIGPNLGFCAYAASAIALGLIGELIAGSGSLLHVDPDLIHVSPGALHRTDQFGSCGVYSLRYCPGLVDCAVESEEGKGWCCYDPVILWRIVPIYVVPDDLHRAAMIEVQNVRGMHLRVENPSLLPVVHIRLEHRPHSG